MRFFDYQRSAKPTTPSRSSSTGDDADRPVEAPSLTQFFADASLYKQVISNPDRTSFYRASENETIKDFADLVGRHLEEPERALAGRFARLSTEDHTWLPDDKAVIVEEPEEYTQKTPPPEQVEERPQVAEKPAEAPPQSSEPDVEPTSNLKPEEIIELLRQEHGALAPDGEEKLILETDAALVQDVIILVRRV